MAYRCCILYTYYMQPIVQRCFGNNNPLYAQYHDTEWGKPVYDDTILFEFIVLEGAQAGLSFETILKKREGYRQAFYNFDVYKIVQMTTDELEALRSNESIIRNRLKIYSVPKNARAFIQIQEEFGSFSAYVWSFVNNATIHNHWQSFTEVPTKTVQSSALSKDLQKRGMTFVGSTIMYAYMQAMGLVNDHLITCHCYRP
jgi:DNA-3-methyladenine glycosylase I